MEYEDNSITLIIQHMGKKEPVMFPMGTKLRDFQLEVEQRTHVPVTAQKVVHRGRDLARNDPDIALEDCRIKDKDLVMILGRPVDLVADKTMEAVRDLEKQAEAFSVRLDSIQKDMDGLLKGFVPASMTSETRSRLEKRLLGVNEELMRLLERLDAVSATAEEVRRKRKSVVTAVNAQMDRVDRMKETLSTPTGGS